MTQKDDSIRQPSSTGLPVWTAFGLGAILIVVDLGTKKLATAHLPYGETVQTAVPFLSWKLTSNTGGHYLFGQIGEWVPQRVYMAVAGAVVMLFVVFLARNARRLHVSPLRAVHMGLIAGLLGSYGNSLEAVLTGKVTDFFVVRPFPWPSNLSDQFLTLSQLLVLLWWFLSTRPGDDRP